MLQHLESPDDVIAIRGSGKVTACARDAVIDRVDDRMSKPCRVAAVVNQAWARVATRLESVVLPGISNRTFMPVERDVALAWVRGSSND